MPSYSRFSRSLFLSTPSARRATRFPGGNREIQPISIHALREEGDRVCPVQGLSSRQFLSTPSARRATPEITRIVGGVDISIHALREEGDNPKGSVYAYGTISIHALREEGDSPWEIRPARNPYFYPRPPRGGRLISR